ncbi:glycosyltransferase [Dysgonomonas sp.]
MKVALLTASHSRLAGGLFFTMQNLATELQNRGVDVVVVAFDDQYSALDKKVYGTVPVIIYDRINIRYLREFGYSRNLSEKLEQVKPDVIHIQGLWMYHSYAALQYKKKHPEVKIIIEPHGMLDPWAVENSAWKKKIVGWLFEYENLKKADYFQALCKSEYDSIRKFGLNNPIKIIPNGVILPQYNGEKCLTKKKKTLLYVGRIHPKKGLYEMLEGVGRLKTKNSFFFDEWDIHIAGWDQNGHLAELEKLCDKYRLTSDIKFLGPIFGDEKEKELTNADAFILPSLSEGLPMSVLEAWAYKLPVVMTEYCNLPEGFEAKAAIKVDVNPHSISQGLEKLYLLTNAERFEIGENGYSLVCEKFTWQFVVGETEHLYREVIE